MKKVVLLGDSIRLIGYGSAVEAALSREFEVWQPSENCRYAKHTLRMLFDNAKNINGADIVHWNCGLWDTCDLFGDGAFTPKNVYVEECLRVAKLLLERCRTVIFATTTPAGDGNKFFSNERIREYNAAVIPELVKLGVVINDLYTPISEDIDSFISKEDRVHLTQKGSAAAAKVVENAIRDAANASPCRDVKEYSEVSELGAPV